MHPSLPYALLPAVLVSALACGGPPPVTPQKIEVTETKTTETKAAEAKTDAKAKPAAQPKPDLGTYAGQLAALDKRIAGMTKVAQNNPRSPIAFGRVAEFYLSRARLSGSYDDYAAAESMIARAFEAGAKQKYGPYMVRARLNYTLHRLDRIDEDVAKATSVPTRDPKTLHERTLFAANLAFQRGQYEEAAKGLQQALELRRTLPALASMAQLHWKSGRFDEAEALYREALEHYRDRNPEPPAWVHLQLGLMDLDRGRWDEALVHYRDGEAQLSGYWLLDEHMAEIFTLQGHTAQAKALYTSIIERTHNPEFMDAMAELLEAEGDTAGAKAWLDKARARYQEQMERYPEAAYGHALEHFLAHGDDPAQTVALAEKNHALRPNADAKRLLAEAYLAAGRAPDAKTMLEQALASPIRTADLHATAAAVYAANGDETRAAEQRAAAMAINPKIELD